MTNPPASPRGANAFKESTTGRIREAAIRIGFAAVGVTTTQPLLRSGTAWRNWIRAGYHGNMRYLTGPTDRANPLSWTPAARSLLMVAMAYPSHHEDTTATDHRHGFVARYARGVDYHHQLKVKLRELADACQQIVGPNTVAHLGVDTVPLLERAAAMRAGVGFIGKSGMLIVPGLGSYVLLGELLLTVPLLPSPPALPRCGECTACRDACPTGAIVAPFVVDARRCLSYLTIENRTDVPLEWRHPMGNLVFGCDRCQEVCPFNAARRPRTEPAPLRPKSSLVAPLLTDWLEMGSGAYRRLVRDTALARASRNTLSRNAAIALGNSGNPSSLPALNRVVRQHPSAMVREHAKWAIQRLRPAPFFHAT